MPGVEQLTTETGLAESEVAEAAACSSEGVGIRLRPINNTSMVEVVAEVVAGAVEGTMHGHPHIINLIAARLLGRTTTQGISRLTKDHTMGMVAPAVVEVVMDLRTTAARHHTMGTADHLALHHTMEVVTEVTARHLRLEMIMGLTADTVATGDNRQREVPPTEIIRIIVEVVEVHPGVVVDTDSSYIHAHLNL